MERGEVFLRILEKRGCISLQLVLSEKLNPVLRLERNPAPRFPVLHGLARNPEGFGSGASRAEVIAKVVEGHGRSDGSTLNT